MGSVCAIDAALSGDSFVFGGAAAALVGAALSGDSFVFGATLVGSVFIICVGAAALVAAGFGVWFLFRDDDDLGGMILLSTSTDD